MIKIVEGRRGCDRPKIKWTDCIKQDLKSESAATRLSEYAGVKAQRYCSSKNKAFTSSIPKFYFQNVGAVKKGSPLGSF